MSSPRARLAALAGAVAVLLGGGCRFDTTGIQAQPSGEDAAVEAGVPDARVGDGAIDVESPPDAGLDTGDDAGQEDAQPGDGAQTDGAQTDGAQTDVLQTDVLQTDVLQTDAASCTPVGVRCDGSDLVDCDGTTVTRTPCLYGCNNSRKECNECTPSTQTCTIDDLIVCGADGLIDSTDTCDYGCNAAGNACNECPPSTTWCDADNLVVCSAAGTITSTTTCDFGCNTARVECNDCEPSTTACVSDQVVTCNADGTLGASTACPLLGCEGTSPPRCWVLAPSNGLAARMDAGSGDVALAAAANHYYRANTDSGVIDDCICDGGGCPRNCVNVTPANSFAAIAQSGGPELGVWSFNSLTVAANTLVRFGGSRPAAMTVKTTMSIAGSLRAHASFEYPGPGGAAGVGYEASGGGSAPGGHGSGGTDKDDSGGGGGGFGGTGGAGGAGGGTGGGAGGQPVYGTAALVPLVGGSSGGGGGDNDGGNSGAGGGGLQLVAGVSIQLLATGVINAGGGGGRGGRVSGCSDNGAGGGGGAGGGVLLEAPQVTLAAGAVVAANGGSGGEGSTAESHMSTPSCVAGDDGADAGLTATPTAGPAGGRDSGGGGAGGAGTTLAGAAGGGNVNGGGGGGGVGRLRANTRRTTDPLGGGLFTPSMGSAAATHGAAGLR